MKGAVKVYEILEDGTQNLIEYSSNLVVDGAGESIVDMLTTPSSVLGISPRVMDTSNWRWGALSFGPPASAFQDNAYYFPLDEDGNFIYYSKGDQCLETSADITSLINFIGTSYNLVLLKNNLGSTSSYVPPYYLPSYPDPLDKRLEKASTAYALASSLAPSGIETVGTSYGQFENRIQFAPNDASSYFQGVFPHKSLGRPQGLIASSFIGDFSISPTPNIVVNSPVLNGKTVLGGFNYIDYMDYRGFCHVSYSNNFILAGQTMVSGVNVTTLEEFVQNPKVAVSVKISPWDVWAMNAYGGLHTIGLWNIDCKESLKYNEAPFLESGNPGFIDTTTGITKQQFKLFAKKVFTENLCRNQDATTGATSSENAGFVNPKSLLISWTIDFRSQK